MIGLALQLPAAPQIKTSAASKDGLVTSERQIYDNGVLLYEYMLITVEKTQARFSETHSFYLKGKKVFTLFENDTGKTHRWISSDSAVVFYTLVKGTKTETVTVSDRMGGELRWLYSKAEAPYFELELNPVSVSKDTDK